MATRNLYELPDVAASLLTAVAAQDKKLLFATVKELLVSEIDPTPYLVLGWLLSPPTPYVSKACYEAYVAKSLNDLLAAVASIASYELLPVPEPETAPSPTEQPTRARATWTLPWSETQNARFEQAVRYALKTKNYKHAAYLMSALGPTEQKAVLVEQKINTTLFETTAPHSLLQRYVEHAYAALTYEGSAPSYTKTILPLQGRTFSIPVQAYATWHIHPKPATRLVGLPLHIMDVDATPFWKTQLTKYRVTRKENEFHFPDDASLEEFYETNFPNDIPDEWSTTERAKSHSSKQITAIDNPWLTCFASIQ
jgi:hypothetical protein